MNPWLESLGVCLLAVTGILLGRWFSRRRSPYWTLGYFIPLVLIFAYGLANYKPGLAFVPPFSWLTMGRNKFVSIALVSTMVLVTPLSRIKSKRARLLIWFLLGLSVMHASIWPFLAPAFNRHHLAKLKTHLNSAGICEQSTDYNCGPAAAVTALRRLGLPAEEGEIAILAHTTSATGTPPDILAEALQRRYAANGLISEYRVFSDLKELKDAGLTLAVIRYSFWVDHYVAVLEVNDNTIVAGDPFLGLVTFSSGEFLKKWKRTGVVLRRAPPATGSTGLVAPRSQRQGGVSNAPIIGQTALGGYRFYAMFTAMDLLPFKSLPPHRARRFVPAGLDLGDWGQTAPCFDQLETRASEAGTTTALQQWLLDWGELSAALDEESAKRYIAMTCHTDNPEAEKAYLHFLEHIEPQVKPRQFKLAQIYIAHPVRSGLPSQRYEVFDRDTRTQVELFRPENVPLETEEAKLGQQYQKLSGSLTVQFRGEEKTLVQMGRYLEEPDRELRKEAWGLVAQRRLQEADKFEEIFEQLIRMRQQIAKNAGFVDYRDYAFRRLGRFDYTAADCERFHTAVESEIMPVIRALQAERQKYLKVDSLRPWDLAVDVLNRPPLRPFEKVDVMVERTQRIFDQLDGDLAGGFRRMQDLRLLDLANRKGKAPGGYQSTLAEARVPFIFMNAVGVQRDVETILHESGHAFHALATREEDLYAYRGAPIEFCEVASMSMELLGNKFLECFYSTAEADRARRTHLEGILGIFPWIATVDAFQHWVYTHPGHSRAERTQAWVALMDRFGGEVDWSEHDAARANLWHRQLHIFLHAFYYIEYGIAQLGALQVWANSKRDQAQALAQYKQALRLGGSRPLPELFKSAGCRFDFGRETIGPLMGLVRGELAKLPVAAD